MRDLSSTVITTDRLVLRPVSEVYGENIFREFTPDITLYMYPRSPDHIDETLEFLRRSEQNIRKGTELVVAILLRDTEEFLGGGGVHNIDSATPELGIWIKKSAQGYSYGLEAVAALKAWADDHLAYSYLRYPVAAANIPSRNIPEALGGIVAAGYEKTNMSGRTWPFVEYHIYPTP